MKLVINKGVISIEGTPAEELRIDAVAHTMQKSEDCVIVEGQLEGDEYYIQLTYDARDFTIAQMTKLYKESK